MPEFKIGDIVCWKSTQKRTKVLDINKEGHLLVSPHSTIYWSPFFFKHVIEPNSIMKDITESMKIMFALTNEGIRETEAKMPTKAYADDAGYDLYCTNSAFINTNEVVRIPTGVICAIPPGYYGQINDRSSMGLRGAKCLAGVIDSGYRGEISVLMTNLSKELLWIKPGDKIAQLIIHAIHTEGAELVMIEELTNSDRSEKGFGSSGNK